MQGAHGLGLQLVSQVQCVDLDERNPANLLDLGRTEIEDMEILPRGRTGREDDVHTLLHRLHHHEGPPEEVDLDTDLLADLTTSGNLHLFAALHDASGQAPSGTIGMSHQQDASVLVLHEAQCPHGVGG